MRAATREKGRSLARLEGFGRTEAQVGDAMLAAEGLIQSMIEGTAGLIAITTVGTTKIERVHR